MSKTLDNRRDGFSLVELLVVIAIMATLAGLTLAGVQKVRAAAARASCADKLRQLGLASQNYHAAAGRFPTGCSTAPGEPLLHATWITRLLPYIEQEALWSAANAAFKADPFFESPPHRAVFGATLTAAVCPTDPRSPPLAVFREFSAGLTSYLGNSGLDYASTDGVLYANSKIRFSDIVDGSSCTLLAGERPATSNGRFGWWYAGWGQDKTGSLDSHLGAREVNVASPLVQCDAIPARFTPKTGDECDAFHFWSLHPGGANFALCDGSVRFLAYSADSVLPALATRAGGETVSLD